ncbi:MAG: tetratricopeptide repeat protein [Desulfobulbaceae bacterium]|nr:tetratricopeptide repeat protein [Desulfobulbaceae bacterium]
MQPKVYPHSRPSDNLKFLEARTAMKVLTHKRCSLLMTLFALLSLLPTGALAADGDKEDFDITKIHASHGDANAQYLLGLMYATGKGTSQDLDKAAIWYKKSAEEGNAEAQYQLGSMFDRGKGQPQNFTKALFWYNKAIEQGHTSAKASAQKIEADVAALKSSAEQGKADAQITLGKMYSDGNGVPQDDVLAFSWYQKAAEQGDLRGECNVGQSYAEGKGVTKDYAQAVAWYRKAAEQGDAESQYRLGSMYHKGRGVPQSGVDAYAWLLVSASQGYNVAIKNKDFAISKLNAEQQAQAEALATELQAMIDSKKP